MNAFLTLVVNLRTVFSTKALVFQSFIVHVELLHHSVVELVPTSTGAATKSEHLRERKTREENETVKH